MAFALFPAGLLRSGCSSVPRSLPPVLCGRGAGPGLSRSCSLRHITTYDLESGLGTRLPRSFSYPPPPSHGLSRLGVRVCLHILKCCLHFQEYEEPVYSYSTYPDRRYSSSTSQHFKMSPPFASSEGVSASGDRLQSDGVQDTHLLPHSLSAR